MEINAEIQSIDRKARADQEAKQKAHKELDMFHHVCDLYNQGELDDPFTWKLQLKSFQDDAKAAKKLIVFLYEKDNCEATRAYMMFVAKILVRLSYLIHEGRRETNKEWYDFYQKFREKYNLKTA